MFLRIPPSVFTQQLALDDLVGMPSSACGVQARPAFNTKPACNGRYSSKVQAPVRAPAPTAIAGRVRIVQEPGFLKVLIDLPDFTKEEVKVEVDGHKLHVAAEKIVQATYTNTAGRVIHRERRVLSSVERSLRLGKNIDTESLAAVLEGGVLALTMKYKAPKTQKPRRIPIQGLDSESIPSAAEIDADKAGPSTSAIVTGPVKEEEDSGDHWVEVSDGLNDEGDQAANNIDTDEPVARSTQEDEEQVHNVDEPAEHAEEEEDHPEDGSVEECEY